jgi:hypothetical protein
MKITISARQRDALYDQILDRLTGIGDIEMAIQAEKLEEADRLAREYSDYLQLLANDLGVGEGSGETIELTTPPEALRRALVRLRELAVGHASGLETQLDEIQTIRVRSRHIAAACASVLEELDDPAKAISRS